MSKPYFSFLKFLFTDFGGIAKVLLHYTNKKLCKDHIQKTYPEYINGLPELDLLDMFPDFEEEVFNYTYLDGTSRVSDVALLRALAKRYPGGRYLEMGTWRGESISNIAPLVGEALAISFSEADMLRVGTPPSMIKANRYFSKNIPNLKNIEANSQTYHFDGLRNNVDMVFVDADHKYPGVTIDTRNAFTLLRDDKSVIVWHDYGRTYEEIDWEVYRGILDGTPADKRGKLYHVSNTLCAVYIPEPVKTIKPEKNVPNKKFTLHVKATRV